MYSSDYIKRMIEQLGQFWAQLLEMIERGDTDSALDQINEKYREYFGVDSSFLAEAPEDYLLLTTTVGRVGDVDKALLLTDLLTLEGEALEHKGDYEQSAARFTKALNLISESALRLGHTPTSDVVERVDELQSKLADDDLPMPTLDRLFRFYEKTRRYADAEDMLFEMLGFADEEDDVEFADSIAEKGVAFYRRLQSLTDAELERGGLPRDEVEAGLQELTVG